MAETLESFGLNVIPPVAAASVSLCKEDSGIELNVYRLHSILHH